MIYKTPRQLPCLADMLRDMGCTPQHAAKVLGVSRSTVYRWMATATPRHAALALFWCTSWGAERLDGDLWQRACNAEGLVDALRRDIEQLHAEIDRLGRIGDYGSANDPTRTITIRYGLDGAGTQPAAQPSELAAIDQAGPGREVYQARALTG